MNRFVLFLILVAISSASLAQRLSVRSGDREFDDFNYVKAIEYYEYALKSDSDNAHVLRRLAQSFHKINHNEKAAEYFELLIESEGKEDSDLILLGDFLKERGQYVQAKRVYKKYLKIHPDDEGIKKEVENVTRFAQETLKDLICDMEISPFNSIYSDFSPVYYNGKLIFSSGRKSKDYRDDKYDWNGEFFLDLFIYDEDKDVNNQIVRFGNSIGSKFHEGSISFSADLKKMLFTRSNYYKGKLTRDGNGANNLKIFFADEKNGKWKVSSEFQYNSDDYSVGHPSLSRDGKVLYFISNMPGGYGGTDIYKCSLINGEWSKPENLGDRVNTKGNEMFPFFNSRNSLFFSSNGRAGKGGLDLYVVNTDGRDFEAGHLGSPLNSSGDDFSFVMHTEGRVGYFASNRPGGVGEDDIYSFKIEQDNRINISIKDSLGNDFVTPDMIKIIKPEGVKVNYDDVDKKFFFDIKGEQSFRVLIEKFSYSSIDTVLYSHILDPEKTYHFKMKRSHYSPNTTINFLAKDKATGTLLIPDVLQIVEPEITDLHPELGAGNYNVKLKNNRNYRVFAKKDGYYALDFNFFCTDTLASMSHLLEMSKMQEEDIKEEYLPDDLASVYFDFDKSNVKLEAYGNINKVVNLLKKNNKLMVTLVARTDTRGTSDYNDALAFRRASATREFFVKEGIDIERVVILALGEASPFDRLEDQTLKDWYRINRCVDFELNTFLEEQLEK
jgi:outer membrane protein OmpA-like peptidoglycan-associated protein/Tol biopolymer transport system component